MLRVRVPPIAPMSKKLDAEAKSLHRLIGEGKITEEDFPELVSMGLAQETVDYYFAWKANSFKGPSLVQKAVSKVKEVVKVLKK